MPVYRVLVLFEDSDEAVVIKDKTLLKAVPTISSWLWLNSIRWEQTGIILEKPIKLEFPRAAGELVLANVLSHREPPCLHHPKLEDYPELVGKNTTELKDIIECASFLGCEIFVKCVGFVIADKIRDWSVEDITRYFGLRLSSSQHEFIRAGMLNPRRRLRYGRHRNH